MNLLGVEQLTSDYYAVFKNVTKFSFWELENLIMLNGLDDTPQGRKALNQKIKVLTSESFHAKKEFPDEPIDRSTKYHM